MKKNILLISLLMLALGLAGQDAKQDFADGEFFLAQEEYEEALFTFTKVYNAGYEDNANINYRIGICLLQIPGRKTEAIPYLEKAVTSITERYNEGSFKETSAPPDAHLYLGNAYRINHEFERSCEQYLLFDEYVGTEGDIQSVFAAQQVKSCTNAVVAINDPVNFTTGNLGQLNQTHNKMYNLVVSHDLQTMAFMGRNPFYSGVYVSRKEGDVWKKPLGINPSIMSEGNMDVVGLSADGNVMLLAVTDPFSSNLYTSRFADKRWYPAESMGKPINSKFFESHASFSPDMKKLYFTSNRNESIGAMDIFVSELTADSTWGEPVNLGPTINTQLNEETPTISPDGKRLYFSSQGHNSIGGFDVFYSELQEDGSWGEPVNLGYPLNSTDDDFTITPSGYQNQEDVKFLFANSEEEQHALFKFEMIPEDATPVPVPFGLTEKELLALEAEEKQREAEEKRRQEEEAKKVVAPVVTPEKYLIQAVFFGFDSYALDGDSKQELDEIAGVLGSFSDLNLEILGHTDAKGPDAYNQKLSERRAGAVADYLANKGISRDRLSVKGFSEKQAIAINQTPDQQDSPEGRKYNRRVEFKVSVSDKVVVEMEEIAVPDHLKLN